MPDFSEWHNNEVFALPRAMQHKHYVGVPKWRVPLQPPQALLVTSPAVSAYSSGVLLRGPSQSCIVRLFAKSELTVCTIMCFLSEAFDRW